MSKDKVAKVEVVYPTPHEYKLRLTDEQNQKLMSLVRFRSIDGKKVVTAQDVIIDFIMKSVPGGAWTHPAEGKKK